MPAKKKKKTAEPVPEVKLRNDIEESTEILASQIKALAEAGAVMERSALKKRTIVWLVARAANVSVRDAERVLNALPALGKTYLR